MAILIFILAETSSSHNPSRELAVKMFDPQQALGELRARHVTAWHVTVGVLGRAELVGQQPRPLRPSSARN